MSDAHLLDTSVFIEGFLLSCRPGISSFYFHVVGVGGIYSHVGGSGWFLLLCRREWADFTVV